MRTRIIVRVAFIALALSTATGALAQDPPQGPPSQIRGFAGGAALASIQPERFASRRDLRGAPEETKPGALFLGGITLPKRFSIQGELGLTGRLERLDDEDDLVDDRWDDRRDALASVLGLWRAVTFGALSLEPVGGFSVAFARQGQVQRNRDKDDDSADDVTRVGVVGGLDLNVAVARHLSIIPTFRLHRLERRQRQGDDDRPELDDGSNVYRFGIGAKWTF